MRVSVPGVWSLVVIPLWPSWLSHLFHRVISVVGVDKRRVNAVDGIGSVVLYACAFLAYDHSWCVIWLENSSGLSSCVRSVVGVDKRCANPVDGHGSAVTRPWRWPYLSCG